MLRSDTLRLIKIFGTAAMAAVLAACADTGTSGKLQLDTDQAALGGVNPYLWAASLETIDFMPLRSADPQAGVIITDWYADQQAPGERFRANVLVLDSALRADALRVNVFKQARDPQSGSWSNASINPNTAREVENAILTRARELRLNALD